MAKKEWVMVLTPRALLSLHELGKVTSTKNPRIEDGDTVNVGQEIFTARREGRTVVLLPYKGGSIYEG